MKRILFVLAIILVAIFTLAGCPRQSAPAPTATATATPKVVEKVMTVVVTATSPVVPPTQTPPASSRGLLAALAAEAAEAEASAHASGNAQSHYDRVAKLAPIYWNMGPEEWLKTAGYTWTEIVRAARQPEEETFQNEILVSGFQVEIEGLNVPYPAGMTTDAANVVGRCYKPSLINKSRVCTDVRNFTGTATLWVDVSNWGQLVPKEVAQAPEPTAAPTGTTAPTAQPKPDATPTQVAQTGCLSLTQLKGYGQIETSAVGADNGLLYNDEGLLAGAVLRVAAEKAEKLAELGWTIQGSNPDVKSAWGPEDCYPLAR